MDAPVLNNLANSTMRLADLGEHDEPMFLFYIYEHEAIRNLQLNLGHGITIELIFPSRVLPMMAQAKHTALISTNVLISGV